MYFTLSQVMLKPSLNKLFDFDISFKNMVVFDSTISTIKPSDPWIIPCICIYNVIGWFYWLVSSFVTYFIVLFNPVWTSLYDGV